MRLVLPAIRTKLLELNTFGSRPFVLGFAVIAILALAALELNNFARHI